MNNNNVLLFFLILILIIIILRTRKGIIFGEKRVYNNDLNTIKNNNKIASDFSVGEKNNNKLVLNNVQVENYFNKNTIENNMRHVITEIIKVILKKTNNMNNYQHYVVKEIHDIHQQIDMHRNQRYVVHFFIYSVNTYTTKKLLVDFVIINSQLFINYIGEDIGSIYALVDKYDLKVSKAYQDMKKPYSFGYLHNRNNAQMLDLFYRIKKLNVFDYNKSINDYPDYISKLNGFFKEDISELVNKYLPKDAPSITSPKFCDKTYSDKWDMYGINVKKDECRSNNNTYGYMPNIPDKYPGNKLNPRSYNGGNLGLSLQEVGYNSGGYNIQTTSY